MNFALRVDKLQVGPTLQSKRAKKGSDREGFGAKNRPAAVPVLGRFRATEGGGREKPRPRKTPPYKGFYGPLSALQTNRPPGFVPAGLFGPEQPGLFSCGTPEGNRTPIYSSGGCRLIHWATGASPKVHIVVECSSLSTILPPRHRILTLARSEAMEDNPNVYNG